MKKVNLFLDTNIILSFCQSRKMELYGEVSNIFIEDLKKKSFPVFISDSVKSEFEDLKNHRIETLIQNIKKIWKEYKIEDCDKPPILILEDLILKIRSNIENSRILDLIELELYKNIDVKKIDESEVKNALFILFQKATILATEIDKLYSYLIKQTSEYNDYNPDDLLELKAIGIKGKDKHHLSKAYHYSEKNDKISIFITIDNGILSKYAEIEMKFGKKIMVSTPIYTIEKATWLENT